MCWVLAAVVVVVFSLIATALTGPTGNGVTIFQPSDQIAMILLGVAAAAAILAFARPSVVADADGLTIRNVIGGYRLPWQVIRSVRFERGSSWVTLELADEDVVSVMAIQSADRLYAVEAARTLRQLLTESQRPEAESQPLDAGSQRSDAESQPLDAGSQRSDADRPEMHEPGRPDQVTD